MLREDELEKKGMGWAKPYLDVFHKLVKETSFSPLELSFRILSNISENNVIILGVETIEQLKKNVEIINNLNDYKFSTKSWWEQIPYIPRELLNPSLW